MKDHSIPAYDLGEVSMRDAFDKVFGADTLRMTHGDTLVASPWQDNKRTTTFEVNVKGIPWALRHVFHGHGLPVTVSQTLDPKENSWTVSNDIAMHFVGASLFKTNSWFKIHREDGRVYLTGSVSVSAKLPLPLNRIAEGFMLSRCKKEIETYTKRITEAFAGGATPP